MICHISLEGDKGLSFHFDDDTDEQERLEILKRLKELTI